MDDIVEALIEYHAQRGRKIRITGIKQGKGFALHDVLIPGRLTVSFKVIEGDPIPDGKGIMLSGAGAPVTILTKQ